MANTTHLAKLIVLFTFMGLMACSNSNDWPALDESGNETASAVPTAPTEDTTEAPAVVSTGTQKLLLNQAMTLRYEKSGILESKVELPAGTQIEVPENYEIKHLDFRNSSGGIERSSTGFLYPIKVLSVTSAFASQFPTTRIAEVNRTAGGLFLFASIVGSIQGTEGSFAPVVGGVPGAGFLAHYGPSGKPKIWTGPGRLRLRGQRSDMDFPMSPARNFNLSFCAKHISVLATVLRRTSVRPKAMSCCGRTLPPW